MRTTDPLIEAAADQGLHTPGDAGLPDAGLPDAGLPDAGLPDAGLPDAGLPDAGLPDAGLPDAGLPDAGLPLGGLAPDFELRDQFGQHVRLSSFRGHKAVALVFYPFAFSSVCTSEMSGIKARLESFLTFDSEVLAISCDPVYSLRAFADADGLNFPLLSDYWPHGAVTRSYGVFDETRGCPQRSSYVVDLDGVVRWSVHHASPNGRDLDEHLRALQSVVS